MSKGGPLDSPPTIDQAINDVYPWLEIKCSGCTAPRDVCAETDCEAADLEAVIQGSLIGEYGNPIRVIAFNTVEHWSDDVSADIAHKSRRRCDLQVRDIPLGLQDFTDHCEGRCRDIQLPMRLSLTSEETLVG